MLPVTFFDLALQTTVPEIKTAKDFLQKMASDINSMNLSSCQAAQGIIGGLFPPDAGVPAESLSGHCR